ncbi:hypothetical protein DA717_00465 [Piscirickettsiaceae bacterium NZ-RLO2]|nr:hypothetical protein DA717_00465 [Piscirickettsiaceae bacterium NZ-RLO2]
MSLICELLELLKREPLTKAEFEYKLFSEGDEQVLKSIMRKDGQRALLKNLKELIKEYNIQTIDALEQLKSDLLRESDSREFCKKYGIDHSPVEFTFHQGFYFYLMQLMI